MREETQLLNDVVKWLKVLAFDLIRSKVDTLSSDDKMIYNLSIKGNSTTKIAKLTGKHHSTVNNKQKAWYAFGIMETHPVRGGTRYVRLASLEELGINLEE